MQALITHPDNQIPAARVQAAKMDTIRLGAAEQFRAQLRVLLNSFWHNRYATPAEMAAEFGTGCAQLFAEHAAAIRFLASRGVEIPEAEYTPPLPFTINQDGSVTIGTAPTP